MTVKIFCRIKDLRKKKDLTQEDLAAKLGISRQSLISLEQSKSLPSLGLAMEIADFFEREVEDIFKDNFEQELPAQPDLNILDKGKNIVVETSILGINPKDIKVEVADDHLVISDKKSNRTEIKKDGFYHKSTSFSNCSRVIPLPVKINSNKSMAEFKNGVLKILLPKLKDKKTKRLQIKIKK